MDGETKTTESGVKEENKVIIDQVKQEIKNTEVVAIAAKYIEDGKKSDIQTLLRNPQTRPLVIGQLKRISDVAYRSLVSSLIEGPGKIHAIGGSQAKVDVLGEEMVRRGSSLYTERRYKVASDPDYRGDELRYREVRKISRDNRWLAWDSTSTKDREAATSILAEAETRQDEVRNFIDEVKARADLAEGSVIATSERVKSLESLLNKIAKFRKNKWGEEATIADAVDLLGGRMVVSDLKSLEAVMQSVESLLEERPEFVVLRKENKFTVNHKTSEPYRAIHYVIALPEKQGQLHSFELQLSTFPALLAGDLAHDAIYKPHLLNLPAKLQQVVRDYNWESNERELRDYLGQKAEITVELTNDQKIEKTIADLDYNGFYDLVLSKIDLQKPLDERTKDYLSRFHAREVEKLQDLRESDEATIIELSKAAHNSYYRKNARQFYNLTSDQLGSWLPDGAVDYLTEAGKQKYRQRYEVFNGKNNKLSVEDLELYKLTDEELKNFFTEAFKDVEVEGTKLRALIERIKSSRNEGEEARKERQSIFVMNLNQAPFATLFALTEELNPDGIQNPAARSLYRETLIAGQIKAVATCSLLTEIGGYDENGNYRDLSLEALPGSRYSLREMLTHMFFITVNRPSSETASLSFAEFATSPRMEWARDNDKMVDRGILSKLVTEQLLAIEKSLTIEEDPIMVARFEKARYELVGKYVRTMVADPNQTERVVKYIDKRSAEEVMTFLADDEQTRRLMARVKNPAFFAALTNYLTSEADIPDIFSKS